jgi:hypothetical protein
MDERSIIFTTEMIHAILRGRKTQTRRLMRPQPDRHEAQDHQPARVFLGPRQLLCPFGSAGSRLWVRERWGYRRQFFDPRAPASGELVYGADGPPPRCVATPWKPSLYMPRSACRLVLQIVDARPQRLQEISEADAVAEGCPADWLARPAQWFHQLWDQLSQAHGQNWRANPWVWVLHFGVAQRPSPPADPAGRFDLEADGQNLTLD